MLFFLFEFGFVSFVIVERFVNSSAQSGELELPYLAQEFAYVGGEFFLLVFAYFHDYIAVVLFGVGFGFLRKIRRAATGEATLYIPRG